MGNYSKNITLSTNWHRLRDIHEYQKKYQILNNDTHIFIKSSIIANQISIKFSNGE